MTIRKIATRRGDEEGAACGRCQTPNRPSRSFCRGCGASLSIQRIARKAPVAPPKRRKRPKPVSDRHLSNAEKRREVVRTVHDRDKVCQGEAAHAVAHVPCEGALEVHEIISRAQWSRGYLEPDNCILLCHAAHEWVTTHPFGAHALGLLRWSYERGV